jgi:DNA-binding response OmpR family regulator
VERDPNVDRPLARILIVEDHGDTAEALARLLSLRGHTVDVAHTVADARAQCACGCYDLVVVDIGLPDGSGIELLPPIRDACPGAKVIAYTGYGTTLDAGPIAAAGFDAVLLKPTHIEDLLAYVPSSAA